MSKKSHIILSYTIHNGNDVVIVNSPYSKEFINIIRNIPGSRWSKTMSSWYFLKDSFNLFSFFNTFKTHAYIDYSALKKTYKNVELEKQKKPTAKIEIPPAYLDVLDQKRYSINTKNTYSNCWRSL